MTAPTASLRYRTDLDGLRGMAALCVALFHAFPELLPGGFIGVDVFFVLSGYVITRVVLTDAAHGGSLGDFYARRVLRLFPALALVLSISWLVAVMFLPAGDVRLLASSFVGAAGWLGNLVLAQVDGRMGDDYGLNPLLHLWSLGIEAQCYVLVPWCLLVLKRVTSPRAAIQCLLAVVAVSFVYVLIIAAGDAKWAFYDPLGRLWEFILGVCLAWRELHASLDTDTPRRGPAWRHLVAAASMASLVASLWVLAPEQGVPGWHTWLPIFAVCTLVWAGPYAWVNRRWLSARGWVWLGRISYPLYLWHWPVLAAWAYATTSSAAGLAAVPPLQRAAALCLAVLLAWATHRWLEQPVRQAGGERRRRAWRWGVIMGAVAAWPAWVLVAAW